MTVSLSDLNGIIASNNTFLPELCTVKRAGSTLASNVPVRVAVDKRPIRLAGYPSYIRTPRWKLNFQQGQDINFADHIIAQGSTYAVTEILQPRSYETLCIAFGILIASPDSTFVLPTNNIITFRRIGQPDLTNVNVYILDLSSQYRLAQWMVTWDYSITWDSALVYGDGSTIQAGDQIIWNQLTNGQATLRKPRLVQELLAYSLGVFRATE